MEVKENTKLITFRESYRVESRIVERLMLLLQKTRLKCMYLKSF